MGFIDGFDPSSRWRLSCGSRMMCAMRFQILGDTRAWRDNGSEVLEGARVADLMEA
ncbi:hypothetical protein HerbRD11066_17330 [Herbidospora sp. RD11066]